MSNARHYLAARNPSYAVWQNTVAGGNYHQCTTMAMPVYQPGQAMMKFVGQNPAGAGPIPTMQMMQPGQQQMEIPMMMPYYGLLLLELVTSRGRKQ
jgi:hypothetical protein